MKINLAFPGARAVFALMLREMATTYGRSPGGYAWVILEPVAGIALLTIVLSLAFSTPPLGSNFALFYASGYLPFTAYASLTGKIGGAIRYSRPLLAYPAVTYFDAVFSKFLLGFLTNVFLFIIVISGIILIFDIDVIVNFPRLLNGFGMMAILAFGFGSINCYLFGAFPVWEQFWSILNRPLFIISGLFFLLDSTPEQVREIMLWNPLAHILMEVRAGLYPTYEAPYASSLYVYGVGTICIFFGLLLLYRHHKFLISEGA